MNLFILFVFLIFIQNVKNAEEIHTGYHGIVHVFEDDFTFELSFSNDGKDKRIENHMLISHSQHNASGGITIQLMTCEANAHFDLMLAKDISLKKCEQKLDMPLGKCNQIMVELNQKRQEAHTQSDSLSSFREDAQRKMENLSSAEIYGRKLSILLLDEYCRSLKAIHDQLIVKFMDEQNNKATLEELSRLQVQLEQSSSESQSKRQKLEKLVQKLRSENARLERELRLIEHGRRNREPMEDMESQDRRSDRIQENGENVRSDNQTGHKPINGKMIQNPQGHVMQQPEAQISNNEEAELNKLFTDVMDIFNNHVTGNNAQTVERDGNKAEFAENRWHRMYEAVYEELKKVRLHEWNGKFKEQMRLVVLGNGNLKEKYKQNFADLRKVLEERGMVIFERDLECVAAAGEIKDLMLGGRKFMVERNHHGIESTELPLQISKLSKFQLALEQARSENPTLFIAVEFFNLELQTSRLVNEPEANFDFTAVFELTVSDLFIHYLQTESIKMELYIINNGLNYELWSEAKIPLRKLLFAQTPMQFRGELIFSAISNDAEKEQKQHPVMTQLAYIVKVPFSLLYALAMQRQKMTANTFILLGSENVYEDTNELIIQIHRCVGLDKLKSIHDQNGLSLPTTYVAYDFFRFSMHMSKLVAQSRTRIFGESQTWRLPAGSEAIHKYLLEEDLLIFVIEEDSNATENKQIGQFRSHALDHISLPLFPLSQNQKIRGSLPLADRVYESIASGLSIEVAFVFEDKENGISEWLRDKLIHINTLILSMRILSISYTILAFNKHKWKYQKNIHTTVFVLVFLLKFTLINGDATLIISKSPLCSKNSTGITTCTISEIARTRIETSGLPEEFILQVQNEEVAILKISVNHLRSYCMQETKFFTRQYVVDTVAFSTCDADCDLQKCVAVAPNFNHERFKEGNIWPGVSGCEGRPAYFFKNGCTESKDGCLWTRKFAKPDNADDTIYKVVQCTSFSFRIPISVEINGNKVVEEIELVPRLGQTFANFKIIVDIAGVAPVPMWYNANFLVSQKQLSKVDDDLIKNMLRCKNLHQAIEFHKCFIPEVAFRCTYNSDWAECIKMLPFDLNSLENFNSLPQHELFFDGKEIYIEHKFQPVEIELHLVNYNISLLNYNPNCVVKIEEFDGCYSCLRGAKIKYTCSWSASFPSRSIMAKCFNAGRKLIQVVPLLCSAEGYIQETHAHFSTSDVDLECEISCGATFNLKQKLTAIAHFRIPKYEESNIVAKSNESTKGNFFIFWEVIYDFLKEKAVAFWEFIKENATAMMIGAVLLFLMILYIARTFIRANGKIKII